MIKIKTDEWCEQCTEFEPDVDKRIAQRIDYINPEPEYKCDTTVTCIHKQRCCCMVEFLRRKA